MLLKGFSVLAKGVFLPEKNFDSAFQTIPHKPDYELFGMFDVTVTYSSVLIQPAV